MYQQTLLATELNPSFRHENIEFDAVARSRQETQEVVLDNSYEDLESFEREAYELKKTTLEKTL